MRRNRNVVNILNVVNGSNKDNLVNGLNKDFEDLKIRVFDQLLDYQVLWSNTQILASSINQY